MATVSMKVHVLLFTKNLTWEAISTVPDFNFDYSSDSSYVKGLDSWFVYGNEPSSKLLKLSDNGVIVTDGPNFNVTKEWNCIIQIDDWTTVITGGYSGDDSSPDVTLIDWKTKNVSSYPSLNGHGRALHACGLYKNSSLVVAGGLSTGVLVIQKYWNLRMELHKIGDILQEVYPGNYIVERLQKLMENFIM